MKITQGLLNDPRQLTALKAAFLNKENKVQNLDPENPQLTNWVSFTLEENDTVIKAFVVYNGYSYYWYLPVTEFLPV